MRTNEEKAAMMDEVCKHVSRHHADPGSQAAHEARCAAALVIDAGGELELAFEAAVPTV